MTYIKKDRRAALDTIIEGLVNRLRSIDPVRGDLSYTVTRIVLESLRPVEGWTRQALADCVASLYEASDEIQRRMTDPFGDTEIETNGDLECFREEWHKPHGCKCSTAYNPPNPCVDTVNPPNSPCISEGTHPAFNVKGAHSGRFSGSSPNNACSEVPRSSLSPGMTLDDLGVVNTEDGELKPITEALTDEQIDKIDDELKTTVSFMYSDNLGGVTVWRPYTGEGVLLPSDMGFDQEINAIIAEVEDDRNLDKWVKDIPIRVWKRMVLNGTPFEAGDDY